MAEQAAAPADVVRESNETTSAASAAATAGASAAPRIEHRRRRSRPRTRALTSAADDGMPPENIDEFRLAMARRIATFLNDWRHCDQPLCRRARRCEGANWSASGAQNRPPPTPEQEARASASLYYAVKRRLAECEAEELE